MYCAAFISKSCSGVVPLIKKCLAPILARTYTLPRETGRSGDRTQSHAPASRLASRRSRSPRRDGHRAEGGPSVRGSSPHLASPPGPAVSVAAYTVRVKTTRAEQNGDSRRVVLTCSGSGTRLDLRRVECMVFNTKRTSGIFKTVTKHTSHNTSHKELQTTRNRPRRSHERPEDRDREH